MLIGLGWTVCCIYHKPKDFDESSSEDDSSDEDSDSSLDDGRARPRPRSGSNHNHNHHHPHPHPDGAAAAQRNPQTQIAQLEEAAEPNAYEMVPSGKKGKGKRKSIGTSTSLLLFSSYIRLSCKRTPYQ
jgi:protein phosphatase 1 regulatory subunit 11